MNSIWFPRQFLLNSVEGNQKGGKFVGAVDSQEERLGVGLTEARTRELGQCWASTGEKEKRGRLGWFRDKAWLQPKLIRENRNIFFYF
jgi:hypothetical protein